MELSTLRFVVETKDLEEAAKKIDALGVSVSKINKPLQELSKNSEKAADSSNKAARASESKSKAIEKESENAAKLAKLLENLTNKQYDLSTGSTSAEASVLKLARSFGATTQEALKPFKEILEEIRKLSSNPFDSAIGSVRSITQEYDALNQRAELASKGIYLTTKQLKEFSKISNELKGQFKAAQIDITSEDGSAKFDAELKKQQDKYLGITQSVNTLKAAEKDRNDVLNQQLKQTAKLQEASDNLFRFNQMRQQQEQQSYKQTQTAMTAYYSAMEKEARQAEDTKVRLAQEASNNLFKINQLRQQQEQQSYKEIQAAQTAYYSAMEKEARQAEDTKVRLAQEASDNLFKIHQMRQQQDQQGYDKIQAAQRAFYLALEKEANANKPSKSGATSEFAMDKASEQFYKNQIKAQKDAAKAAAYVADVETRLAAALDATNSALDKQATDGLVKYEKALKAAGFSADQAAIKLAATREQFNSVADKKQADKLQYLARAISVQMGDVGISLASGMNPLLVMIQQGDQIRGAIQQAGASGKELEKAMGNAAVQIAMSFLDTGKAIGGFFVNAIKSTGSAITKFAGDITGVNSRLDNTKRKIVSFGSDSFSIIGTLGKIGDAFIILAGIGIFTAITAFVAYGVALKQVIAEESALSKSLALTGASLGLTRDSALGLSQELAGSAGNVGSYVTAITEIAKAGNITSDNLKTVASTIVTVSKVLGVSSEQLSKNFSKISEKPLEALIPFAKELGTINAATLEQIRTLEAAGKQTEASKVAIEAYAEALKGAAATVRKEMSGFETIFYEIGSAAKSMWNAILNAGRKGDLRGQMNEAVSALIEARSGKAWYSRFGRTNEEEVAYYESIVQSIGLQINAEKRLGETKAENVELTEILGRVNKQRQDVLSNEEKRNREIRKATEDHAILIEKGLMKQIESEKILNNIRNKYKDPAKNKDPVITVAPSKDLSIIQKDYNEQLKLAEGFARDERSILKARFDAGLIDRADFITSDTALLLQAEQKQLDVINSTSQKYTQAYQDQFNLLFAALGNAKDKDNRQKLLDDITNLGKEAAEFFATLEDKKGAIGSAFSSREVIAVIGFAKAANESNKELKEFLRLSGVTAQNLETEASLRDRLAGASEKEAEQIKAVSAATKSQVAELSKLMEMRKDALIQYQKTLADPNASGTVRAEAYRAYITAMENANTAIAVSDELIRKAGVDAVIAYEKKERDRINSAITDGIVTALIEGGESGGKKLRSILEAELRRPITVFVRAVVDSLTGGAGSAAGSAGGNILSSMGGSLISSTLGSISVGGGSLAAAGSAFGTGFMTTLQGGSIAEAAGIYSAAGMQGVSTGLSAGATVAQYVPEIAIALAVANALGVFRSTKQVGGGISGTLGGSVDQYGTMRKSGTLFNGPSYYRQNQGTFAGNDALQQTFDQLKTSTKAMADTLKLSSVGIDSFTKTIDISFDSLTDAQRQEKLASTFASVNDELAALVLGAGATAEQLSTLYNNVMQQRYDLETQLLELQGKTLELRERERAKIYDANKGLFDQIKALEDQKAANEAAAVANEAAAVAMEKLTSVTTTIVDEINRLRGVSQSSSGLESQFAILTAQARSGDLTALAQLPEVTKGLEQIAASSAVNATDIIFARARLAQSLQDTLGYFPAGTLSTATTSVATLPSVATTSAGASVSAASSNQELLAALVIEVQGLRAEVRADVSHNAKTAKILERVNQDGESLTITALV